VRRVVITGIGIISPLGSDKERFWHNLINGNSGIGAIDSFDVSLYPCRIGGEVKDFDPGLHMEKREAKKVDRFTHFGVAAALQAWRDSGLDKTGR
jgi:3-oxoacyl-[acyl-carrier-protein] synthase II